MRSICQQARVQPERTLNRLDGFPRCASLGVDTEGQRAELGGAPHVGLPDARDTPSSVEHHRADRGPRRRLRPRPVRCGQGSRQSCALRPHWIGGSSDSRAVDSRLPISTSRRAQLPGSGRSSGSVVCPKADLVLAGQTTTCVPHASLRRRPCAAQWRARPRPAPARSPARPRNRRPSSARR